MSRGASALRPPVSQDLSDQKPFALTRASSEAAWDSVLLSAPRASLLQSWRWGEFKDLTGWRAARLLLGAAPTAGERTINPQVCGQLLTRSLPRLPLPVSVAYMPRGPVWVGEASQAAEASFWHAVHAEARKQGAIFLKVEPDLHIAVDLTREEVDRRMSLYGFQSAGRLQPARTIVLDISLSEEDLLKAMKPKTRYNLRLAQRRGVTIRRATGAGDLEAFYSLLKVTGDRDEFGIHTPEYYRHLWRAFGPDGNNNLLLLFAEHPDAEERAAGPIGALLAMRFGHEAIYMYGASDNRGREHMPNYLLQWEAMRWAREGGCTLYDFWGIPDPPSEDGDNEEVSPTNVRSGLRGVYWFKKGFGGYEIDYPGAYDYVYNPVLYKAWMRWRGANLG